MPQNPILERIRQSLGRQEGQQVSVQPPVVPPRQPGDISAEIELLIKEINAVSGNARRMDEAGLDAALYELVKVEQVRKAVLWSTPGLQELNIALRLRGLDVTIIDHNASKQELAQCDLGVTEVDFALPETGTLGLLSSAEKPRAVSLLPRVHLAVLHPGALRADLHQVFAEAQRQRYLVFVTGPSRTADIELTLTLGVHGPKALYCWIMGE